MTRVIASDGRFRVADSLFSVVAVDDHFAKALGDTWVKLQEKDQSGGGDQVLPLVT